MNIGLVIVYVAAIALGILPVARISRLRKTLNHPFLARFQIFALLGSFTILTDLIIRYLGPSLNVVRSEQVLNHSMLFGFILVPALIALCYFFIRLVFGLLQKPIPRSLTAAFAGFWGLFFIGFIYAEVLYFQTGGMSATKVLEVVFNAGLTFFFLGAVFFLFGQARNLQDPRHKTLARTVALVYLVVFLVPFIARVFGPGMHRRWMIIEYVFFLVLNAGVAVFLEYHLQRNGLPAASGNLDRIAGEIFAQFQITQREQEIVWRILEGWGNAKIAATFFISEKTVETHIYNIYQKTGIKNRIQLLNLFRGNRESASDPE